MNKGVWIWYPADYEVRLARDLGCKRCLRDTIVPPEWRVDDRYGIVAFCREFELPEDETVTVKCLGKMNISVDWNNSLTGFKGVLPLKKGKHYIEIRVYNPNGVPSLCISGRGLKTDKDWTAMYGWEQQRAKVPVGYGEKPVGIKFVKTEINAERVAGYKGVYDFGRETMGRVTFLAAGKGEVGIFYGESLEECLDTANCELTDTVRVNKAKKYTAPVKAFRFVNLQCTGGVKTENVAGVSEMLPVKNKADFTCGDGLLNRIYKVSERTLHLCMREFFLDGIKRDRWVWGGDAYQSFLMNYYSFGDMEIVKRTLLALAGKPPYDRHINRIPSYTFFWLMGFAEYYERTGDAEFCGKFFSTAAALMDFCISRANKRGLIDDSYGDWMYVDWAEGLDDGGEVAYNNILFCAALKKFSWLCGVFDKPKQEKYAALSESVLKTVMQVFWDEKRGCFLYNAKDKDKPEPSIKRQPNIMAVLFNAVPAEKQKTIIQNVLLNDKIDKITTPYMRFFELDALAQAGRADYVREEIKAYWGGMLDLGATSFWETFDPRQTGAGHYAMYGRKYGKSLCHAWGASPIYLLARYKEEMKL